MNLQVKLALQGINLKDFAEGVHLRIARGARNAAEIMAARAKVRLRADVIEGGLGDKVANAWRADIYPKSAAQRTHTPAVHIYSKAPLIVTAFGEATTIRAKNARYMAIPTENCPRVGRRKATPVEVEAMFNQDLIIFHGRGQQMLAFVDVVKAKRPGKFRRATKGRAKQGRKSEMVLMFVMVRQVHLTKRLDWREIFKSLQDDWATLFPEEVAKAVNAGSN